MGMGIAERCSHRACMCKAGLCVSAWQSDPVRSPWLLPPLSITSPPVLHVTGLPSSLSLSDIFCNLC